MLLDDEQRALFDRKTFLTTASGNKNAISEIEFYHTIVSAVSNVNNVQLVSGQNADLMWSILENLSVEI